MTPYPEPPFHGTPIPHPNPATPTIIPTVNQFPNVPAGTADCPVLSVADQLAAHALIEFRPSTDLSGIEPYVFTPEVVPDMQLSLTQGTAVESNDYFRFRAFGTAGAVPVSFFGRVQRKDGTIVPFSHVLTTNATNTIFETLPRTGEGVMLGAAASVPIDSITVGSVSAVAEIGRLSGTTFLPHTLLFSGQLDDLTPLTNGSAGVAAPVGRPTVISIDDSVFHALPYQVTVTPSAGKRLRFTSCFARFKCSAAVGTRTFYMSFLVGGKFALTALANQDRTANLFGHIEWSMGAGSVSQGNVMCCPLPETLYFYDAVDVYFNAYNVQVGDNVEHHIITYAED